MKHESFRSYSDIDNHVSHTQDVSHTQKLHKFVKGWKLYTLSQATSSANSPQTKLQLILDFHCMFSSDSILTLCPKWSGVTIEIISYWYTIEWWLFECKLCSKLNAMIFAVIFLIFSKPHRDFADFYSDFNTSLLMSSFVFKAACVGKTGT